MKIYFLTYGDRKFYISKKHLVSLAKKSEFFDHFLSLGPKDLDKEFKEKNKKILQNPRGGGFWIWKYHIISKLLEEINENDIIVYCDAGASINTSLTAKKRFYEYIDMLKDSQFSNLRMECEEGYIENQYTYKETFEYFNLKPDSDFGNSLQLQAGHMLFKKNSDSINYFHKYDEFLREKSELITDSINKATQINNFVENRHDQSIFSLLSKVLGAVIIPNETEFRLRPELQHNYPFLSVRAYGHGPKDYIRYLYNPQKFTNETIFFS
tara:strand:- start:1825 stop:2628 length:804 start_codon:yes stop_codon:yes gene_type:complete